MRVFSSFNSENGEICPVCKTSTDRETHLVPVPGTESNGNVECKQVHVKCYDLVVEMSEEG